LPTEAEWEYACRAGTTTIYPFGDDEAICPEYSNQSSNVLKPAVPGGTLLPNAWGLFDVIGNVWEWCWDEYAQFTADAATDPQGPAKPTSGPDGGDLRVYRGGGVANQCGMGRSSSRGVAHRSATFLNLGFRVVCGMRADAGGGEP
jgi:formylglycine-generating enzyme required for sulfatase activity